MSNRKCAGIVTALVAVLLCVCSSAQAVVLSRTYDLTDAYPTGEMTELNGLSARAVFTWDDTQDSQMTIVLTNTSIGFPVGFSNADQILTGISFDFGEPGYPNGDALILGGSVVLGADGTSINMIPPVGPGDDLSGEWGFGNTNGTGLLTNLVTAEQSQATPFVSGTNIDGPQGGIVTNGPLVPMGGLGAVADSVIITLNLDRPLADLDFLDANGVRAEFGSDAAFVIPEPTTALLFVLGGLVMLRRHRCPHR